MNDSLIGKTLLITGSTDGLGKLLASRLAVRGAEILLHGRNPEKGKIVTAELSKYGKVQYYNADFASLREVNALGDCIRKDHPRIDVLINNAAIGKGRSVSRELSRDGHELRFAVNFLAQVLLTERLLPVLADDHSMVINVSSVGQAPVDFSNLMLEKGYDGFLAYRQSKTALIMYTLELATRLENRGIRVNAVHPASLMNTKMVIEDWGYTLSRVEEGAEAVESLLDTKRSGEYFDGKKPAGAIPQVYEKETRKRLMEITRGLLKDYL